MRIVLLLASLFWTTAVIAQSGADDPSTWHGKATAKDLQEFAQCAVRRHPALAREMIAKFDTYSLDDKFLKVFDPDCLGVISDGLKLPGGTEARFMIAEALVRTDLGALSPGSIKTAPQLLYPRLTEADFKKLTRKLDAKEIEETTTLANITLAAMAFGECVVRFDPATAHGFIIARPGSAAESAVISTLGPALGQCVNNGQQFKIDKAGLRGVVAVAYFRLASAAKLLPALTVKK